MHDWNIWIGCEKGDEIEKRTVIEVLTIECDVNKREMKIFHSKYHSQCVDAILKILKF